MARRLVRARGSRFDLDLDAAERAILGESFGELRALLIAESPSSDPAVARLFPPAYPDDLLQNLDFERTTGNGLLDDRLAGLDEAEAALSGSPVGQEQLLALLRTVNDLRLLFGTRLDVGEDTRRADFADEISRATFDLYAWLGWLVDDAVAALGKD